MFQALLQTTWGNETRQVQIGHLGKLECVRVPSLRNKRANTLRQGQARRRALTRTQLTLQRVERERERATREGAVKSLMEALTERRRVLVCITIIPAQGKPEKQQTHGNVAVC